MGMLPSIEASCRDPRRHMLERGPGLVYHVVVKDSCGDPPRAWPLHLFRCMWRECLSVPASQQVHFRSSRLEYRYDVLGNVAGHSFAQPLLQTRCNGKGPPIGSLGQDSGLLKLPSSDC